MITLRPADVYHIDFLKMCIEKKKIMFHPSTPLCPAMDGQGVHLLCAVWDKLQDPH